jgi:hypothetical protein
VGLDTPEFSLKVESVQQQEVKQKPKTYIVAFPSINSSECKTTRGLYVSKKVRIVRATEIRDYKASTSRLYSPVLESTYEYYSAIVVQSPKTIQCGKFVTGGSKSNEQSRSSRHVITRATNGPRVSIVEASVSFELASYGKK